MARSDLQAALLAVLLALSWAPGSAAAAGYSLPPTLQQQLLLRQYATAVPELERLAYRGNAEARYQLALCRLDGKGTVTDPAAAVALLEDAAASGHVKANYLLGSMFYQGRGVETDPVAARRYLTFAAERGHHLARSLLSDMDASKTAPPSGSQDAQKVLWAAARAGSMDSAANAVAAGADLDRIDPAGETAMIMAINGHKASMAAWLLGRGASVTVADRSGDTPLHLAAGHDMGDTCRRLIASGADIEAQDAYGRTPLMVAVAHHHADLTRQLIALGASPDHADRAGRTARDLALHLGDADLLAVFGPERPTATPSADQQLDLLRKQVAEKDSLYYRWPLVAAAVAQGETDLALSLVHAGEDPWLVTPGGINAVSLALERGQSSLARDFLRAAPLDVRRGGATYPVLLGLAAGNGDSRLVGELLERTSPESIGTVSVDETPAWRAISAGQSAVAQMIIGWQPPDMRRDDSGIDLLLLASQHGMTDVVVTLLSDGFDPGASDGNGRTAAWFAADQAHCDLLEVLASRGMTIDAPDRDGQTPLIRAVLAGAAGCVARAISAGADVNRQTRTGNTGLMLAAESRPNIVRLLLDAGADCEIRNQGSYTALMLATSSRCVECIEALVAAGANTRRKNAKGVSAVDIAGDDPALLAALRR